MKDKIIETKNIEMFLNKNNLSERLAMFIWGILIYAFAFSVFFSPCNLVTGGTTGLSLLVNDMFSIDISIFTFLFSAFTLVIGYILLGKYNTAKTFFGVILLPIFLKFTSIFTNYLDFSNTSLFLVTFFGGALMGLGNGMIFRSDFSAGGFQTLYQILYKYFGISIGKSTLLLNGVLILLGGLTFGISNAMYAVLGLYVASVITDKIMLETSATKTFYIVTLKDREISDYLTYNLGYRVVLMNARGGYSNDNKRILMCAVATREYYRIKEVLQEIDENVFFLITDTYEIFS